MANRNKRVKNKRDQQIDRDRRQDQSDQVTTEVEGRGRKFVHKNLGAWYYDDPELLEQATRLSFQSILGTGANDLGDSDNFAIPTTEIIYLNPCPGVTVALDANAPHDYQYNSEGVNLAAFKLFTMLSMQSGRTASYAPQDITTLILQIGELISQIEWGRRFFGIAFTYNERNRVWPKDVVDMLGIDSADFFNNLADYRMKMNTLITRVKQLPIPENIAYFHKCEMLYQTGFTDSSSTMAQVYLFNPATTWIMDESYTEGTMLDTVSVTLDREYSKLTDTNLAPATVRRTFQDWMDNVLEPMVDALLQSSTLNVIYADILNYVSRNGSKLWEFDYISEAYSVAPEYAPDMLEIIHNMVNIGAQPCKGIGTFDRATDYWTPYNNVYPDAAHNALTFNPHFLSTDVIANYSSGQSVNSSFFSYSVVDLQDQNADVDTRADVMQYRVMPYAHNPLTGNDDLIFIIPDHYPLFARIFASGSQYINVSKYGWFSVTTGNQLDTGMYTVFDWYPMRYAFELSGTTWHMRGVKNCDINYPTSVDANYLRRLLKLSYLGLFNFRK